MCLYVSVVSHICDILEECKRNIYKNRNQNEIEMALWSLLCVFVATKKFGKKNKPFPKMINSSYKKLVFGFKLRLLTVQKMHIKGEKFKL